MDDVAESGAWDLTRWQGDAIVNAANERMLGGGGVDGAIHQAAGPQLLDACYEIRPVARNVRCPTGRARITPGFRLKAKHIIHTVGPIYEDHETSAPLLCSAFKSSFDLCRENELKSVAFPALSCGMYGYPTKEAAEIAIETTLHFSEGIEHIEFVLYGQDTFDPFVAAALKQLEPLEPTQDEAVTGKVEDIPNKPKEIETQANLPEGQEGAKGAESAHGVEEGNSQNISTAGKGGSTDSNRHAKVASPEAKESGTTSTGAGCNVQEESHSTRSSKVTPEVTKKDGNASETIAQDTPEEALQGGNAEPMARDTPEVALNDGNAAQPMFQDAPEDVNAAEPMSQDEAISQDVGDVGNKTTAVNSAAAPTS